jgi:hypothetical protein
MTMTEDDDDFFGELDDMVTLIYYQREYPDIHTANERNGVEFDLISAINDVIIRERDVPASAVWLRTRSGLNGDEPRGQKVFQSPGVRKSHLELSPNAILLQDRITQWTEDEDDDGPSTIP